MSTPARLLLVDDEQPFLHSTAALLRREGYECDCASDADEASAALSRGGYDLLITDLRMPGNDDLQLLKQSAARFPSMPIVVLTGYPSLPTAVEALRLSVCDYRTKPLGFRDLLQCVETSVEKGRAARRREPRPVRPAARPTRVAGTAAPRELRRAAISESVRASVGSELSPREWEIVEAVTAGERVATIARCLFISERTVRNHLQSIFRKLDVHSQIELVARLRIA